MLSQKSYSLKFSSVATWVSVRRILSFESISINEVRQDKSRQSKLLYLTIHELNFSSFDFDIRKAMKAPISKSLKVFRFLICVQASRILKKYSSFIDSIASSSRLFYREIHWLSMSIFSFEFKRYMGLLANMALSILFKLVT